MSFFMNAIRCAGIAFSLALLPLGQGMAGEKIADPSRIVSIGGAVTEIVYALGKGDLLIARDSTSLFPPEAMKLPDVGYMRQLSPEGVLSVNPSAILMIEGSGPKPAIDVMRKSSIPVVTVPEGYDAEAITAKILAVGAALGADSEAEALAKKISADIDEAVKAADAVPADKRKRVLFVLTLQGGKIMAAGDHTAANGILKLAGAVNVAGDFHGYKPINDEAVISAAPDVILMMSRAGPGASDEEVLSHPAIKLTPAGKSGSLLRLDGASTLGFGPRTADAIRTVSKALYGG
ncbi:heme/hemin ABC transporter substrate-binding protein [Rhizobium sp. TRM95796]|uniref:heme/hemin ABC transporter substrate-binding protein n=1 Tax=Rhizobium sp. TRM95796 TaxID=2979862 RepID=UPI0021E78C07|nr:ABC transporter substrate-binding protein [Rhizobium sp. TRM95796]MCV3766853.1 ABC transporter substrate-binding protein [Rhizobium sp. TRM95796]